MRALDSGKIPPSLAGEPLPRGADPAGAHVLEFRRGRRRGGTAGDRGTRPPGPRPRPGRRRARPDAAPGHRPGVAADDTHRPARLARQWPARLAVPARSSRDTGPRSPGDSGPAGVRHVPSSGGQFMPRRPACGEPGEGDPGGRGVIRGCATCRCGRHRARLGLPRPRRFPPAVRSRGRCSRSASCG